MLAALDRKLFRDLWHIKGQALAISCVIGAGVSMFVMALCALASLTESRDVYYDRYRFADVFTQVKRAPRFLQERMEQIPGVARAQTRIDIDVTLNLEGLAKPSVARLISIPEYREPELNSLHLRRGRWIEAGQPDEVLVSESFAAAHGLEPGDSVTAVINGRYQRLSIVGIALSPEFVIQIPPGNLLPDDRQFGIFWMGERQLEAAYDMKEAFNSASLKLLRGASQPEVIRQLDALLEPYGSLGAYGRESHMSHQFLSDEIRQLKTMALVVPAIFLSVAAFLLNIVISRTIGLQREQIAALKAFGYGSVSIAWHYIKLVFLICLIGILIGTALGLWLGHNLTTMYAQFYKFPIFFFRANPLAILGATAISLAAAALGTTATLRRAAKLPPAEAMRPEPPASFRPTFVERFGLGPLFPQVLRMILRKLERKPGKSAMSCLGIAMAVAVLILGSFSLDAVTWIMNFQFRIAQRQDVTLSFIEPTNASTIHEVDQLPGVFQSQPFRAVATRFRFQHRERRTAIMGLPANAELFRIFDTDLNQVTLPEEGLLLSDKLARLLGVGPGDSIDVEVLEGKQGRYQVPVSAVVQEYSGTNAYMNLASLNRLMQEGSVISGVHLRNDALKTNALYQTLKETPRVAGVTIKSSALESFNKTIAENLLVMRGFNILFAAVIAFGVVYNSARISLSEQSRELATLRVIGFSRMEVSAILLGELTILTLIALPLGCLLGYAFAALTTLGMDTEIYRIPLVVNRSTFGFAIVTVIMASILSGLIVRRRVNELDLVGVLKTKE